MAAIKYKPNDTVELKDKDAGFYDSATRFKIVRDQHKNLGKMLVSKPILL